MPTLPIFTVDAFTNKIFSGNPAAVCPLDQELSDAIYQKIAFELNLSETAFITKLENGGNFATSSRFGLRWFTPTLEVPLCGHATLSAAHILFSHFKNPNLTITFESLSGDLRCTNLGNGSVELDFPEWKVRKLDTSDVKFFDPLVKECIGHLPIKDLWYVDEQKKVIIVLDEKVDRSIFESLKPNSDRLLQFDPTSERVLDVYVTMQGTVTNGSVDENGQMYDFVSRFFAPWSGVPEDPVTGSMHCALAPLWATILGKKQFFARQCSPRGGELKVQLKDDGRVYIRGNAVTVIRGDITI